MAAGDCMKSSRAKYLKEYARLHDKIPKRKLAKQLARHKHTLRTHGLTIEQYDKILTKQKGVCAICELPCPTGHRLAIDHDHDTNKVRGLLCVLCNIALAQFEKDKWPERARRYVNE